MTSSDSVHFGIEATPLLGAPTGLSRYCAGLLGGLLAIGARPELALFCQAVRPVQLFSPFEGLPVTRLGLGARSWKLAMLVGRLLDLGYERWLPPAPLFHGTDHTLPPLRRAAGVVTVHDLAYALFPAQLQPLNRWYLRGMVPRSVRGARAVITVSEHTRQDLIRLVGVAPEKVHAVHSGIEARFRPPAETNRAGEIAGRYAGSKPYFLYVGAIEPRKNLDTLLDAYAVYRRQGAGAQRLVVAGRPGWRCAATVARLQTEDGVGWARDVADADLPALYAGAVALVHPARYEGFGFTPLEAMACGTPVIASTAGSLPEVLGEAAAYVPPDDAERIAAAMADLASDGARREELRARGLAQAARYIWEETARKTLAVYEAALLSA